MWLLNLSSLGSCWRLIWHSQSDHHKKMLYSSSNCTNGVVRRKGRGREVGWEFGHVIFNNVDAVRIMLWRCVLGWGIRSDKERERVRVCVYEKIWVRVLMREKKSLCVYVCVCVHERTERILFSLGHLLAEWEGGWEWEERPKQWEQEHIKKVKVYYSRNILWSLMVHMLVWPRRGKWKREGGGASSWVPKRPVSVLV